MDELRLGIEGAPTIMESASHEVAQEPDPRVLHRALDLAGEHKVVNELPRDRPSATMCLLLDGRDARCIAAKLHNHPYSAHTIRPRRPTATSAMIARFVSVPCRPNASRPVRVSPTLRLSSFTIA